ncbi:MAG: hypothetical protein EAZ85_08415 [Bacteroidetes bacterium]|nr:MAG: hypothetical protein EAZ85_08415 [Bacteroidota bacterium]
MSSEPKNITKILPKKSKKQKKNWILVVFLCLFLLIFVSLYWFHYYFTPYLHKTIENRISAATNHIFICKIEKFESKLVETSFYMYNLSIEKNDKKWKNLTNEQRLKINQISIKIPKLSIIRWYWWEYIFQNKISLDDIIIEEAENNIQQAYHHENPNFNIKKILKTEFYIKNIQIKNSNLTLNMVNLRKNYLKQKLQKINLSIKNIHFVPEKKIKIPDFLANIHIIDGISLDNQNKIKLQNITFDNKNLHFERLIFQPLQKNIQQNLQIICEAKSGKIYHYHLEKMIEKQVFEADSIFFPTIFLKINPNFSVFSSEKNAGSHSFENMSLKVKKPLFDSSKKFSCNDFDINFKSYQHFTYDSQYRIFTAFGKINSKDKNIFLTDCSIFSVNNLQKKYFQTNTNIKNIAIEGVDWETLIKKKSIYVENIVVQKPNFNFKIDKNIIENIWKSAENQSKIDVFVKNITIQNGSLQYIENTKEQKKEQHFIKKFDTNIAQLTIKKEKNESFFVNFDANNTSIYFKEYMFDSQQSKLEIAIENGKIEQKNKWINLEKIQIIPKENNELFKKITPIKNIKIDGLDLIRLWKKKELYAQHIEVDNPVFDLETIHVGKEKPFDIYELLKNIPFFIKIDKFTLTNGNFNIAQKKGIHTLKNMNFVIPQIHIGKATKYNKDSTKAFFYDTKTSLIASLQNYKFIEKNQIYELNINDLYTNLYDSTLRTGKILIRPKLNKKSFFELENQPKLYAEISVTSFITNTLDAEKWIFEQTLFLKKVQILKPSFYFFFDDSKTISSKEINKDLTQVLQTLPIKIDVSAFEIKDGILKYEQQKIQGKISKHTIEPFQILAEGLKISKERNLIEAKKLQLKLENYNFYLPDSSYQVGFKQLETQLTDSILVIKNVFIRPLKEKTYTTTWNGNIEKVQILSNDFRKWIFGKEYLIYDLIIEKPVFKGYSTIKDENSAVKLPKLSKLLTINRLYCKQGKIQFLQEKKTDYEPLKVPYQLENIEGEIEKIVWESNANLRHCWKNMNIKAENYLSFLDENLLKIQIKKIELDTKKKNLMLDSVDLQTRFDEHFYTWVKKGKNTSPNLTIHHIKTENIDYELFKKENIFKASFIQFSTINALLFKDKRWGKPTYKRLMLNDLFQLIKTPLTIDSLEMKNSYLKYSEQVTKGLEEAGEIFLSDFNGKIKKLSNLDTTTKTKIVAEARVMGEGKMTMEMDIFLNQKVLECEASGELGSMSAVHFNQLLEPNYHIRLKKGIIQGANYHLEMKDRQAKGILLAGYKQLRIQFLKPQNHKKKQGLKNLLANLIIKNRNNMYKKHPKYGEIDFKRKQESFWTFIFMSLGSGLIDTLR